MPKELTQKELRNLTWIERLTLINLTSLAFAVGIAPAVIVLHHPYWLVFFVAGAELIACSGVFQIKTYSTKRREWMDYLAAFFGAVWPASVAGLFWTCSYGIIYALVWLSSLILTWFEIHKILDA